jgi:signal peptidase II
MKKVKFFVINIILITIDQIFKYYILINKENLPNNIINGALNFTYCENRGIAFGIGQGGAKIFALMTLLMIIVALIYIAFKFNKLKGLTVFGIALVISGGIGNLIDRLFRGYVIDYIDFSEIVDFPIFNFADICIVVGVIIIGISYLRNEGGEVNERINS